MNTEHLSRGWALIAEGAQYISLAYAAIDPPLARSGVPESLPAAVPAGDGPLSPAGPSSDDIPLKPQVDAGLGICPIHGVRWTVKAAGVSKAGKPFKAFWRCNERDADGFCSEKPQRIWQDTHPITEGAAA